MGIGILPAATNATAAAAVPAVEVAAIPTAAAIPAASGITAEVIPVADKISQPDVPGMDTLNMPDIPKLESPGEQSLRILILISFLHWSFTCVYDIRVCMKRVRCNGTSKSMYKDFC